VLIYPGVNDKQLEGISMSNLTPTGNTRHDDTGKKRRYYSEATCICGKVIWVRTDFVNKKNSCGCIPNKRGTGNLRHGHWQTRLYTLWSGMKYRCDSPNCAQYKDYGGRGISYCEEWKSFKPFYDWAMANGYSDELTLDKVNNDGNYSPDNCRWTNRRVQNNNSRKNRLVTVDGVTDTLANMARKYNVDPRTAERRLNKLGWSTNDTFKTPVLTIWCRQTKKDKAA